MLTSVINYKIYFKIQFSSDTVGKVHKSPEVITVSEGSIVTSLLLCLLVCRIPARCLGDPLIQQVTVPGTSLLLHLTLTLSFKEYRDIRLTNPGFELHSWHVHEHQRA